MQGLGGGDGINCRQPHYHLIHEQRILDALEHVLRLVGLEVGQGSRGK